jgi:hypothetical protein
MNRIKYFAAVSSAVMFLAASTFADQRPQNGSGDWRGGSRDGRDNGRTEQRDRNRSLTAQGRVTNLQREHDGYRVQLDRGSQWYYVPQSAWRGSRGRNLDLRLGVSINLGGGYRDDRGYIYCDDAWMGDDYGNGNYRNGRDGYGYGNGWLSGTVQRVDYRRGVLEVRESRTGRYVTVDMRRSERRGRGSRGIDVADLRRGDYVELAGDWSRGNVFVADSIDSVDSGRGRGRY